VTVLGKVVVVVVVVDSVVTVVTVVCVDAVVNVVVVVEVDEVGCDVVTVLVVVELLMGSVVPPKSHAAIIPTKAIKQRIK
jgi:hypothetical protein